jgi:hypothetical protein
VSGVVDFVVKNPLNEQLEAAHITMQVEVSLTLNVDGNFKVTGVMD